MELLYLPQCLLPSDMQNSDTRGVCGLLSFKSSCEPPAPHKCNTGACCDIIRHIKPGAHAEFHLRVKAQKPDHANLDDVAHTNWESIDWKVVMIKIMVKA